MTPVTGSSSSPSGGLACAIAALAERQQIGGEASVDHNGNMPDVNMLPGGSRLYNREDPGENYPPTTDSSISTSPDVGLGTARIETEWVVDRGSEMAEAGTSYASSDVTEDGSGTPVLQPSDETEGNFQNGPGPIVPESYEEQMMLAMAVSLAEARSMTSGPGVSW